MFVQLVCPWCCSDCLQLSDYCLKAGVQQSFLQLGLEPLVGPTSVPLEVLQAGCCSYLTCASRAVFGNPTAETVIAFRLTIVDLKNRSTSLMNSSSSF